MYIITGSTKHYAVASTALGIVEVRYQVEEAPAELGTMVKLYADDGMCIREDAVADWEHPRIEGRTIILSNTAPAEPITPTLAEVQSAKLTEINAACDNAITAGCDVTLSDGTAGHISLTAEDQINLSTAQASIQGGAAGYPYHLDGELCKIFPASDILIMARAATAHILYHTTYCNHLHGWVSRCVAVSDVSGIAYGCDLPADLAANMQTILSAEGVQANA